MVSREGSQAFHVWVILTPFCFVVVAVVVVVVAADKSMCPELRGSMDAAFTFWKLYKETLQARYGKALDPCSRDYNVMLKLIYANRFPKGLSLGLALAGAWHTYHRAYR